MEKLNGNQFKFIDYDDVVHQIHPECRDIDPKKIDRWARAAYGKPFADLSIKGADSFNSKLQDWQVQPKCLRSIAGFSLPPNNKSRTDMYDQTKSAPNKRTGA